MWKTTFQGLCQIPRTQRKGLVLSRSLLREPVIGGCLWLLSRAALPVLNKNFVLSGWWAQRSTPEHSHARAPYAHRPHSAKTSYSRDLTLLHSLPIFFHCDLCAVTRQVSPPPPAFLLSFLHVLHLLLLLHLPSHTLLQVSAVHRSPSPSLRPP